MKNLPGSHESVCTLRKVDERLASVIAQSLFPVLVL
jgi:hypothetical protein